MIFRVQTNRLPFVNGIVFGRKKSFEVSSDSVNASSFSTKASGCLLIFTSFTTFSSTDCSGIYLSVGFGTLVLSLCLQMFVVLVSLWLNLYLSKPNPSCNISVSRIRVLNCVKTLGVSFRVYTAF